MAKQAILSSDPRAAEQLQQRIADLEARQERMTAENVIVRKYQRDRKAGLNIDTADQAALTALITLTGYDQERAAAHLARLLAPDYAGRVGWPAYELTNNNANIRRLRERLEQVKQTQATPATTIEGTNGIRFEDCPADNRVRLFYPGKPDAGVRDRLKSNGFRWAPTLGCWQAYRNWRSLDAAKREAGEIRQTCSCGTAFADEPGHDQDEAKGATV